MASCNTNSLFGSPDKYIKFQGGDIIAVEGPNTLDRLISNDLRMPYVQSLKGRVILKAGATNQLMNFLGLGDSATFLAIVARYNPKSKIESDNYVQYNYATSMGVSNYMGQVIVLTGNSTHRIPQLYLTNPSATYSVTLDILVGVIDDTYNFFTDTINSTGLSFIGLHYTNIETYITSESIVIYDNSTPRNTLAFITLDNINSIERSDLILIIDEDAVGTIFLQFLTTYDVLQALSLINYVLKNKSVVIQSLSPVYDNVSPTIYFGLTAGTGGNTILLPGSTYSAPYNSSMGSSFSTTISLSTFGTQSYGYTQSTITKPILLNLLVDHCVDNRDGTIILDSNNISIYDINNTNVDSIVITGTYSAIFSVSDIATNISSPYFSIKIN